MTAYPAARTIQRALLALEKLPPEALVYLVERLIDRLDACQPDCDLEPETDACVAGECGGVELRGDGRPGDSTDAEPDNEDRGAGEDEPSFPNTLRSSRNGLVQVQRRTAMAIAQGLGRPAHAQRTRCIPWPARP